MIKSKVSFRISSETLSLEEISQHLGPSCKGFSLGDPWRGGKVRERTMWIKEICNDDEVKLESQVNLLASYLQKREKLIREISSSCEFDIFIMIQSDNGQGGAFFSPDIMKIVSGFNASITLDIYTSP